MTYISYLDIISVGVKCFPGNMTRCWPRDINITWLSHGMNTTCWPRDINSMYIPCKYEHHVFTMRYQLHITRRYRHYVFTSRYLHHEFTSRYQLHELPRNINTAWHEHHIDCVLSKIYSTCTFKTYNFPILCDHDVIWMTYATKVNHTTHTATARKLCASRDAW